MTRFQKFIEWITYWMCGINFQQIIEVSGTKNPRTLREVSFFLDIKGGDYLFGSKRVPEKVRPFDVRIGKLLSDSQSSKDFLVSINAVKGTLFKEEEIVEIFLQHKKLFVEKESIYFLFKYDFGGVQEGEIICVGHVYKKMFSFWKADRCEVFDGYVLF